jgi:hypothetical protein
MEEIKIVAKLLLLSNNFSQIYEFNLHKKKPFIPKSDGVEFNLGRKNIFRSYPFDKVILRQDLTKEPKYRTAITPLDKHSYFVIVPTKMKENNGSLEITEGIVAKWMGMSKNDFLDAIASLTKEIEEATTKLIEEKKSNIQTLKRYQQAIIDLEARYSMSFVEGLEELAEKIAEKEIQIAQEEQKEILKERRESTEQKTIKKIVEEANKDE